MGSSLFTRKQGGLRSKSQAACSFVDVGGSLGRKRGGTLPDLDTDDGARKRIRLASSRRGKQETAMTWKPLSELLRGGGRLFSSVFKKEGNEAKYSRRGRPQIGVDVDVKTAMLICLSSVILFSLSLPLLWGQAASLSQSFWLTRIVFFRVLGLVYLVAFAVALFQNGGLLGSNGLLPVDLYLKRVREINGWPKEGCTRAMINEYPTLLWLAKSEQIDSWMSAMAGTGMALSFAVMVVGGSNALVQLLLWILYHSINTVGQRWYSFGWESQLLETGFVSIFMCPLLAWSALPASCPTPWVCVWAMRWLTWRIMLGAGMIKIRGDSCWRDLTVRDGGEEEERVKRFRF
eukprot:747778-Hanusia_phi.AAC.5